MRRQPRFTKTVNIKVRQTDYQQLQVLAGDQSVTEWARKVLLKELTGPDPQLLALAERIDTLRYVLFNGLPWMAPRHLVTTDPTAEKPREVLLVEETFRRLIGEADARSPEKAKTLLNAVRRSA